MSEEKKDPEEGATTEQKHEEVAIVDVNDTSEKKLETTLTFTMTYTNPETGKPLVGTFTAMRPTLAMIAQIAVYKAQLCGGQRIDPSIDFINEMIAYCSVVLTDTPKWWTPESFYDATPLRKVWDHVRSWQDSFRKRIVG